MMALGESSRECDLREQAWRARVDTLRLPSERWAAARLIGPIYHENRAGAMYRYLSRQCSFTGMSARRSQSTGLPLTADRPDLRASSGERCKACNHT